MDQRTEEDHYRNYWMSDVRICQQVAQLPYDDTSEADEISYTSTSHSEWRLAVFSLVH